MKKLTKLLAIALSLLDPVYLVDDETVLDLTGFNVDLVAALSDGAIVGSAIVRLVETYGKDSPPHVGEYVKQMKNAMLTG